MPETLRVLGDDAVVEIVLNRPERLNAMNPTMLRELLQALDDHRDCRALLLWGEGRAFCAGRDLAEAEPATEDATAILREQFSPLLERLNTLPAPTIAAVQGACMGSGLGLAFACDVILAADDAQFSSPFGRLGAVLDSGGHYHFTRLLGRHRALELIYTGRRLTGTEAAAMGLVNQVVGIERLHSTARDLATRIAAGPTAAFRISKRLVLAAEQQEYAAVLDAEAAAQGEASKTSDYQEGMRAFREKRQPAFAGR